MVLVNCFRMLLNLSDEILLNSAFHYQLQLSSSSSIVSLRSNRINFDLGTSDVRISILIYRKDEKDDWNVCFEQGQWIYGENKHTKRHRVKVTAAWTTFLDDFHLSPTFVRFPFLWPRKVTQSSGMINRVDNGDDEVSAKTKSKPSSQWIRKRLKEVHEWMNLIINYCAPIIYTIKPGLVKKFSFIFTTVHENSH